MTPSGASADGNAGGVVTDHPPAIELRGIDKRFGAVHANRDVDLVVPKGTIHGIVGENGAGKSTLMSILYGFYEADAGEIRIDGSVVRIRSSSAAIAAGIGMVHQHFMLVDTFTAVENVMLGAEGGMLLSAGIARCREELKRLETDYGLEVPLDIPVSDLTVGQQQRVEILKALYRGAEILILDEPTGVLTPQETDQLFRIFASLRDKGVTVILITHKLQEILSITDNVSVMRRGEMVAHRKTAETDREELAELMVGRKVVLRVSKSEAKPGEVRLSVEDITVTDRDGIKRVDGLSLEVRSGEIVGIAGVSGNGQSELLEALSGIRKFNRGRIIVNGHEIYSRSDHDAATLRANRLAHVPEDRHRMGLVTAFAANESSILGYHRDDCYNGPVLMERDRIVGECRERMNDFDVRPQDPFLKTANFSGGNQQKLVLAREMAREPDVLLVGQPTRGVDIGSLEFIHKNLVAQRDRGAAILLVSVELEEIMSLADRILVMFEGRIVGRVRGEDADERKLGLMMANANPVLPGA
jgi:simple sugar transport system ATP-binding protein